MSEGRKKIIDITVDGEFKLRLEVNLDSGNVTWKLGTGKFNIDHDAASIIVPRNDDTHDTNIGVYLAREVNIH